MAIQINVKGDFKRTERFLTRLQQRAQFQNLQKEGQRGVDALSRATPRDSGKTADSWYYEITQSKDGVTIAWYNKNTNGESNVAVLLHYGHATGTGGYVIGEDYINDAIRPIFDNITEKVWKEVTKA